MGVQNKNQLRLILQFDLALLHKLQLVIPAQAGIHPRQSSNFN
jgi:hypothetical protein